MSSKVVQLWDERHLNDLKSVQGQLTVAQIMTPRDQFLCCAAHEPAQSAMERISKVFDAVPVVDSRDPEDKSAPILGLLHRDRIPFRNRTICAADCVDRSALDKAHPFDRNLIVYINGLTGNPVELIQTGGVVVGLITPYDLERLPVRTALFAQIIDVERLVGDLVQARFPDNAEWELLIESSRRDELKKGLQSARSGNSVGLPILSVGFSVKLDLLVHCFEDFSQRDWVAKERDEIRRLRNRVAHGAPFTDITRLPGQVRNLLRLRALISSRMLEIGGKS